MAKDSSTRLPVASKVALNEGLGVPEAAVHLPF